MPHYRAKNKQKESVLGAVGKQGVSLQKPTLWRYEAYVIRKQQHEWPRGGQGGSAEPKEKAAVVSLGLRSIG